MLIAVVLGIALGALLYLPVLPSSALLLTAPFAVYVIWSAPRAVVARSAAVAGVGAGLAVGLMAQLGPAPFAVPLAAVSAAVLGLGAAAIAGPLRPTTVVATVTLAGSALVLQLLAPVTTALAAMLPSGKDTGTSRALVVALPLLTVIASIGGCSGRSAIAPTVDAARVGNGAVLLQDGRVLVIAGQGSRGMLRNAAIYDPDGNTWHAVSPLEQARRSFAAVRMPDGRVLVAGGEGASFFAAGPQADLYPTALATVEIYDPARDRWSAASSMQTHRIGPRAELMADGRVRVSGGVARGNPESAPAAEAYDAGADIWTPIAAPADMGTRLIDVTDGGTWYNADPRKPVFASRPPSTRPAGAPMYGYATTRLADDRVLIAGGVVDEVGAYGDPLVFCALYEPSRNGWAPLGCYRVARIDPQLTLLADGTVLMTGGKGVNGPIAQAERFDPRGLVWSDAGAIPGL